MFDDWTRRGLSTTGLAPPGADGDEWAAYVRYRRYLFLLGDEDDPGHERWAAGQLDHCWNAVLPSDPRIVALDAGSFSPSQWRAVESVARRAGSLQVTLAFQEERARGEAFADVSDARDRLLALGLRERSLAEPAELPAAIDAARRGLFQEAFHPAVEATDGVRVVGMPECEGEALAAARAAAGWLKAGAAPSDIQVCVPEWDNRARVAQETLADWGIPVRSNAPRVLAGDPGVAAFLLALRLPAEGWQRSQIVQFLRHGRLTPRWNGPRQKSSLIAAAALIRDMRVFRGSTAIRAGIERRRDTSGRETIDPGVALLVFDSLVAALGGLDRGKTWGSHVEAARDAVELLGLFRSGDPSALDALFLALEEHGEVRHRLNLDDRSWTLREFAQEARRIAREIVVPAEDFPIDGIMLATLEEAAGPIPFRIILGLSEGTFPARNSIDTRTIPLTAAQDTACDDAMAPQSAALGREMRRFLDLFSIGSREVLLIYPTTDEKGQDLLGAGFLEDLKELFSDSAWSRIHRETRRLDAVLPEEYCGQPRECRVRALARTLQGETQSLVALALEPGESRALAGVAIALRVGCARAQRRRFGAYDGQLFGRGARQRIAASLESEHGLLSPSQLESYAQCPYQFFLRYIVRLQPPDERCELQEDHVGKGQILHAQLEELHHRLKRSGGLGQAELPALVKETAETLFLEWASTRDPAASEVDAGLRRIQDEQLRRIVRRYVDQLGRYVQDHRAEPERFEVEFGRGGSSLPGLVLGGTETSQAVSLRGKIDRVDIEWGDGSPRFRVIDYKTGSAPSHGDIRKGLALQLALYTIAAEELILREEAALPAGAAYWNVARDGFEWALPARRKPGSKAAPEQWWPPIRAAIIRYVEELAAEIRLGSFPVAPRRGDCERYCEFRSVCRIRQIRPLEKSWERRPEIRWPVSIDSTTEEAGIGNSRADG
jgi:RecB family exonuclease